MQFAFGITVFQSKEFFKHKMAVKTSSSFKKRDFQNAEQFLFIENHLFDYYLIQNAVIIPED